MNSVLAFQLVLKPAESSNVKVRILLKYLPTWYLCSTIIQVHTFYLGISGNNRCESSRSLYYTRGGTTDAAGAFAPVNFQERMHCTRPADKLFWNQPLGLSGKELFCGKYVVYFSIWGVKGDPLYPRINYVPVLSSPWSRPCTLVQDVRFAEPSTISAWQNMLLMSKSFINLNILYFLEKKNLLRIFSYLA